MENLKIDVAKLFDPEGSLIALATSEDDVPCVRYLIAHADDDLNVFFATYRNTKKVRQIKRNPVVSFVVGGDPGDWRKPYARFTGKCEEIDDLEAKRKFWKPVYSSFFSGPEDENFVLFGIRPIKIEFMDPGRDRVEIIEFDVEE